MKLSKPFKFKQLTLTDQRSAMKIGTDGVLLGAWAKLDSPSHILDVGSGCGLVSLMLAQRSPQSIIHAVEIDQNACDDAGENFLSSPFAGRIELINGDFLAFENPIKYPCIVSNPPFFSADTLSPRQARAIARSNASLPLDSFAQKLRSILSPKGQISIIYQYEALDNVLNAFWAQKLFASHICTVYGGTQDSKPKRVLMCFTDFESVEIERSTFVVRDADGAYSAQYRALTKDFHPQF